MKKPEEMKRGWVLFAMMLTMMLAAMDSTIVATAIPQIVGDLGGFSQFSWLFSIYLLIQTITIPIYGKLADMYGRKPILLFGIVVFLLGSATCGAAWNMNSLIAFRGLQAIGAGAIMATVNTIAGDLYNLQERARIQGWLSSVWGVSAILGPTLGGAFAQYATWRWIFFINIPIGIASIILLVTFLFENKPAKNTKVDWKGAVAMLVTGMIMMFGLLQGGQAWPWFSYPTLAILIASSILLTITIRIEQQSEEPILPRWVWKKREILGANLATIGLGIMTMASSMYLPIFSQSVTGVGAIAAGFILASMSLTWPLSSGLSGKLYLSIGFRNTAICGTIIVIIGASTFLLMNFPGPIWTLVTMQMIMGAGFGLISTPLMVGIQSTVDWGQRGVVTGANMFSRYFGQSIGAAIFAAIFNAALSQKLASAPSQIQSKLLPVNKWIEALQAHDSVSEVSIFLQKSFFYATSNVYSGLLFTGVVTLVILLLTPRHFPIFKAT